MKKSLKQQLEEALKDAEYQREQKDHYYSKYSYADAELKKIKQEQLYNANSRADREREKANTLLEIIRWMILPENSKDPWNEIERQHKNIPPKYY